MLLKDIAELEELLLASQSHRLTYGFIILRHAHLRNTDRPTKLCNLEARYDTICILLSNTVATHGLREAFSRWAFSKGYEKHGPGAHRVNHFPF